MTGSIRSFGSLPAVSAPASGDKFVVQQLADGVFREMSIGQAVSLASTTSSTSSSAPSGLTGVYNIDSFAGAQNNTTGNMGVFDDGAASAMWNKILSDASKAINVGGGFFAQIVFGSHQYNWQNPINFVVPDNGNGGSSLPVELHVRVNWNSSIHYTFGNAGFLFQPYTMDGQYDDWDSRVQINNRYQGVSAYAFKRSATAGVGSLAFAALPSNETAGGGVSNFRSGQKDIYDANTGGYFQSYLDLSGLFFAEIKGPAGTSAPGPAGSYNGVANPGNQPSVSAVNVGTSAIRLGGFNIQVWIWSPLPNYIECVLRLVGYCEALMTMNFGGVNCDRGIWSDIASTDFRSLYQGQYSPLFQVVLDQRTEVDCYKIGIDLVRCYIFQIYGGRIWTHASGGNLDGKVYGDVGTNGGLFLRGCAVSKVTGVLFDGPGQDSSFTGHTSASGLRGISAVTHTYSGQSGKPWGPADGNSQRCATGEIDSNGFRGYGNGGTVSPIYYDGNTYKYSSTFNRWYYSPDTTDGYATKYPVQDDSGGNSGYDFVGNGSVPSFYVTPRTIR